jgi:hypothetical protein
MADKTEEGKTIPAGAPLPPEKDTGGNKSKASKTTVKVGDREYNSLEDLAKDHQNLQDLYGKHTDEVGTLRGANKVLTEQIADAKKVAKESAANEPPPTDYEGQLTAIYKQMNDGDITVEAGMQQSNALTAEMTAAKITEQTNAHLQDTLQKRDAEAEQKNFLKNNPDFKELQASGAFEKIKNGPGGGMHDDFSAYYALKAAEGVEKGKRDAAKIAAGDDLTKTVLTKPGDSIKQTNKPKGPLPEAELEASMLESFKGAEGGGP